MNLNQLRSIVTVANNGINISLAADRLYASQPAISKRIKLLEEELNTDIFIRKGRHLIGVTAAGQQIIQQAERILQSVEDIPVIAKEFIHQEKGELSMATTHTQARYVLPSVVDKFIGAYPEVSLIMQQSSPDNVASQVAQNKVDLAIATEALENYENLVTLPCYRWNRCVLVKQGHPLSETNLLTLEDLMEFPIITYVRGFTGRYKLDEAFNSMQLQPKIVITAVDADVIKTYVRLGLGIGIVANMAYHPQNDRDLVALDASHLFGSSTTHIAVRKDKFLRNFIFEFLEMFASHLTKEKVLEALRCSNAAERSELFNDKDMPLY